MTSVATSVALRNVLKQAIAEERRRNEHAGNSLAMTIESLGQTNVNYNSTAVSMASTGSKYMAYVLPDRAGRDAVEAWMWILTFCARNTKETDHAKWCSLLASMAYALFRGIFSQTNIPDIQVVQMTVAQSTAVLKLYEFCEAVSEDLSEDLVDQIKALWADTTLGLLPNVNCLVGDLCPRKIDPSVWYGSFSVWVFTIAKEVSDLGSKALTTARYEALLSKYGWKNQDAAVFNGETQPSLHAFQQFSKAWVRLPGVKKLLFSYAATIPDMIASESDQVFYTTIRMMKYAELGHMAIIGEFLTRYPWAVSIPRLRSDAVSFAAGINGLIANCPDKMLPSGAVMKSADGKTVKDTRTLPYTKMLFSDTLDIARRDSMKALLYVAKYTLVIDQPSLHAYKDAGDFPDALAEFNSALAMKNAILEEEGEDI